MKITFPEYGFSFEETDDNKLYVVVSEDMFDSDTLNIASLFAASDEEARGLVGQGVIAAFPVRDALQALKLVVSKQLPNIDMSLVPAGNGPIV